MRGHHIYTRSWFEIGSKSQNAGTFTVELTDSIFGPNTDDIVYNKLNPMCATVPEAVAPRNSDQSLLRLFHPAPDTTIVSRHWFVTDVITGRGTVPYAYNLIFRGGDNEQFLQNPTKAFSPGATEPYDSFCARVLPDRPAAVSTKYDPQKEDYMSPFVFRRSDWLSAFGFDAKLFTTYCTLLWRAVCGRENAKLGVILPAGMDSELLILATLALMPLFMKKKFGAASNWKGMMDGGSSNAINGLHLICCYEEAPLSDTRLPVIDLTGAGRHENIEVAESKYIDLIWANLDNPQILAVFEAFLVKTFGSVLDKMPFHVIETCFALWSLSLSKEALSFRYAAFLIRRITESFSRNFAKFPFICEQIKRCCLVVREEMARNPQADLELALIQDLCLLAENGEENAKGLILAVHNHLFQKGDWRKIGITIAYHARLLERPNLSAEVEDCCCQVLVECLYCADPGGAKTAQDAMLKQCVRLRDIILKNLAKSEEAYIRYQEYGSVLFTAKNGKLPDSLFHIPERKSADTLSAELSGQFIKLIRYDIGFLGHIPGPEKWIAAQEWLSPLRQTDDGRIAGLYRLFYEKIPADQKRHTILYLEKEQSKLLLYVMGYDAQIKADVGRILDDCFAERWEEEPRPLTGDEAWTYVGDWLKRLENLQFFKDDPIYSNLRHSIGLELQAFPAIAKTISRESMQTISKLYTNTEHQFDRILNAFRVIDSAGSGRAVGADTQESCMLSIDDAMSCRGRMSYWYKNFSNPAEWALLMLTAVVEASHITFQKFIELCSSNAEDGGNRSKEKDVIWGFNALTFLEKYPPAYKTAITETFSAELRAIISTVVPAEVFTRKAVRVAFVGLPEGDVKKRIGKRIEEKLKSNDLSPEIQKEYYNISRKESDAPEINPLPVFVAAGLSLLLLLLSGIFMFVAGIGLVYPIIGPASIWLLFGASVLVAAAFVTSLLAKSAKN